MFLEVKTGHYIIKVPILRKDTKIINMATKYRKQKLDRSAKQNLP
jgi:hypothetical protein